MASNLSSIVIMPQAPIKTQVLDPTPHSTDLSQKVANLISAKPKKRIRIRQKKDRKPWRAPTAYEVFCEQERSRVKAQNPDASSRDINKALGEMWSNFSKAEKSKFCKEAQADKQETAANLRHVEERLGKKLRKPLCAYSLFV